MDLYAKVDDLSALQRQAVKARLAQKLAEAVAPFSANKADLRRNGAAWDLTYTCGQTHGQTVAQWAYAAARRMGLEVEDVDLSGV